MMDNRIILPVFFTLIYALFNHNSDTLTANLAGANYTNNTVAAAVPPDPNAPRSFPQGFRSPLDIPIRLSGSFGELRNNHFHGGLDIKTESRENLRVYSVAEGYVSRIAVAPRGYGNALYIDHPNGYTSVYAHINTFEGEIGNYLKELQYRKQEFEIDEKIPPGALPLVQGQFVAKSGNTGSSGAPHLHFEIRNTVTEEALNPLLCGFSVSDHVAPRIDQVAVYPFKTDNIYGSPQVFSCKALGGNVYAPVSGSFVAVKSAKIGVGIKTFDKFDGEINLNGIFGMKVYDNNQLIYTFEVEGVPFSETRCLNSHIDYKRKQDDQGFLQKCFIDPGSKLTCYKNVLNQGVIDVSDGQPHRIRYEVYDVAGNSSTANITIQCASCPPFVPNEGVGHEQLFRYGIENYFSNEDIQLRFPYGSFYTDIPFNYATRGAYKGESNIYSRIHKVHNDRTPVHSYFDVLIKPTANLPTSSYDKAVIICANTNHTIACGGTWEGNMLRGKAREFGDFRIGIDNTPPTITPINISNGKSMRTAKSIVFSIADNLSGIKEYNGFIDGQWVLFEYDQKRNRLEYFFDGRVAYGSHNLRLEVSDERGNMRTFTSKFVR